MLYPVSSFLVLAVVVTTQSVSDTYHTGEKEGVGAEQRIRGRVPLIRAARAYRRFGENKRIQMPSRQPYKKAPTGSNSLNPKTRYSSIKKDANNVKTTSRQHPAKQTKARPKANAENTRNKYAGVKFPKLDLFPQMRKPKVSHTAVLKVNTTVVDTTLQSQHRAGQVKETEQRVNSKAQEIEQSSYGRPRSNFIPQKQKFKVKTASVKKKDPKSRPDIRPTPSLSRDIPEKPTVLVPSKEDETVAPDLIPSISPDKDGFLTVTHTVFTRTMELYEETLTSLSEVVAMTKLRSTIINNSEIMFAHSEHNHPSRGVTEFIFEEICPTQTFLPQARALVPVYNVLTHTTRITNTVQPALPDMQGEFRIQDIMSHLLPTAPLPQTTSYTTITITKISTITSDVTSDIIITLGGRPVKTEYVIPTTMVFTDLHISRSAIVV